MSLKSVNISARRSQYSENSALKKSKAAYRMQNLTYNRVMKCCKPTYTDKHNFTGIKLITLQQNRNVSANKNEGMYLRYKNVTNLCASNDREIHMKILAKDREKRRLQNIGTFWN